MFTQSTGEFIQILRAAGKRCVFTASFGGTYGYRVISLLFSVEGVQLLSSRINQTALREDDFSPAPPYFSAVVIITAAYISAAQKSAKSKENIRSNLTTTDAKGGGGGVQYGWELARIQLVGFQLIRKIKQCF